MTEPHAIINPPPRPQTATIAMEQLDKYIAIEAALKEALDWLLYFHSRNYFVTGYHGTADHIAISDFLIEHGRLRMEEVEPGVIGLVLTNVDGQLPEGIAS